MCSERANKVGVAIIGAGLSGSVAAISLLKAGRTDFKVFERSDRPGGVWRDNRYPGAEADVPLTRYAPLIASCSGSVRQGFPSQAEMMSAVTTALFNSGVNKHIYFGTDVTGLRWSHGPRHWEVHSSRGTYRAQSLILAPGALRARLGCNLTGLDRFDGECVSSSSWPDRLDLSGKRVAVIGSGPTAAQIVSSIASQVAVLYVFQRNARWVLPRPPVAFFGRRHVGRGSGQPHPSPLLRPEGGTGSRLMSPQLVSAIASTTSRAWLYLNVHDPQLRNALRPNYPISCRRPVFSARYLRALSSPKVRLIPSAAEEVDQTSIVSADGRRFAVDVIVYALGFDFNLDLLERTVGEGHTNLASAWLRDGAPYLGVSTPGFPNLYTLGHAGSRTMAPIGSVAQSQVGYVVQALASLARSESGYQAISGTVHREQSRNAAHLFRRAPWATNACAGTTDYPPEHLALYDYPGTDRHLQTMLRTFDPARYRTTPESLQA
jgi:cyclohexanone monooxygenase